MKIMQKRGLSLLLALVLVVSLFSGLTLPASAATYTYNWGYRGVTATELSSAAQAFYANNGTSYEALSAYSGSSSTSSVPSSDLYYQLKTLMVNNHSTITTYNGTKELYQYTDCQGGGGYISSFYSGKSIGPTWDGTWNREHTWPDSKGLEGSDEDDIMMLRPTATTENGARGNKAYGESSDCYDPNSESGGTYNLHGDVARIFLYVYVRWGNVNGNGTYDTWGSNGVMESKEILLKWMEEDPVDTWELGRNDAVQSITGTRNVFVDYPELAFLLFGEEIPTDMITPSGEAYNSGSSYTITAVSNDTAMGTVSVSGKNINASPADGHMAAGYTVLSGTAEVTQNGNVFAVAASTDCTIQINFKPKEQVAVTYLSNGTLLNTETVYDGDAFTLPDYTGTAPDGYTFIGWLDEQVDHTTTYPAVYKAGSSYTANGETTLYAVFSYISESTGDGTGTWTLVKETSELNAGDQIVFAANGYGAVAGTISSSVLSKIEATFSDDLSTIPELPDDALILTLGGSEGAWTLCNSDGALLGATAVKKLAWDKTTTTWSISISEGAATIQNGTASYGAIQYNIASPRFTTYTSSQSKPQIYKLDSAVTCYTTASCPHEDTYEEVAQAATCTSDGYTAGIYCYDCCTYISGHEVIPAPGHSYDAVVTPPTVTDDGYTT